MTNTTDQPDKPLTEKLGFEPGDSVFVDTTPDWYSDLVEKAGAEITPDLPATHAHLFFSFKDEFDEFLEDYKIKEVEKSIWFSWPTPDSGMQTDLSEQAFRDILEALGWTGESTIKLDESWQALRFLRRKA